MHMSTTKEAQWKWINWQGNWIQVRDYDKTNNPFNYVAGELLYVKFGKNSKVERLPFHSCNYDHAIYVTYPSGGTCRMSEHSRSPL